jgi:hypothetical protein
MIIKMQQSKINSGLTFNKWDIGIVGKSLDARCDAAIDFVKKNTSDTLHINFIHEDFKIQIDSVQFDIDDAENAFKKLEGKSVIIESTSVGFVEILLICDALIKAKAKGVSFVYVEPQEYKRQRKSMVLHRREFELSGEVPGYLAIPGYSLILHNNVNQKVVFFTGYESSRLEKALEDHPWIRSKNASLVFGVPAFNPGWEMNSFANNINIIKERGLSGGMNFGGAANPLAAYTILDNHYKGLEDGEQMFVVPIGTKPQGIGAALFVLENEGIGVLYDHPIKEKGRTGDIASWHLFNVQFN